MKTSVYAGVFFILGNNVKDKNTNIKQVKNENELNIAVEIISKAFNTVAGKFNLNKTNCPTHSSFFTLDKAGSLFNKGVNFYILKTDNKYVGCAALEKAKDDNVYFLEKLAVLPKYRNLGYGKLIVDFIFNKCKELNAEKLSIGIINEDVKLKNWYQNLGFNENNVKKFDHLAFTVCFMDKYLE